MEPPSSPSTSSDHPVAACAAATDLGTASNGQSELSETEPDNTSGGADSLAPAVSDDTVMVSSTPAHDHLPPPPLQQPVPDATGIGITGLDQLLNADRPLFNISIPIF